MMLAGPHPNSVPRCHVPHCTIVISHMLEILAQRRLIQRSTVPRSPLHHCHQSHARNPRAEAIDPLAEFKIVALFAETLVEPPGGGVPSFAEERGDVWAQDPS